MPPEDDCRFPDQVRFLLTHEGMRCTKNPDGSSTATNLSLNMIVQAMTILLTAITCKTIM
ncbi:hypothetical protein C0J52_28173 [Blattella germanica]|nr:hypothetical protein C0J52_28173 [Blattella germanica]